MKVSLVGGQSNTKVRYELQKACTRRSDVVPPRSDNAQLASTSPGQGGPSGPMNGCADAVNLTGNLLGPKRRRHSRDSTTSNRRNASGVVLTGSGSSTRPHTEFGWSSIQRRNVACFEAPNISARVIGVVMSVG